MNKKKTTRQISRLYHYKRKLKYELIRGGIRIDLERIRKDPLRQNKLMQVMKENKDFLFVNSLGVKSERMPF